MAGRVNTPAARSRLRAAGLCLVLAGMAPPGGAAGELVDPTRPPWADTAGPTLPAQVSDDAWRLAMTRVSARGGVALVNGRLVKVGDRIEDARVLAISASQVVLEQSGRRVTLVLSGATVKRPARD